MKKIGILICIFLVGCASASTRITTFKDPKANSYRRILVYAPVQSLEMQRVIETKFVEEIKQQGLYAIEYGKLFLPTREYSPKELVAIIKNNNFDGVLFFVGTDTGHTETYIPPTSTSKTQGTLTPPIGKGQPWQYQAKTTQQQYGGYSISKPWVYFRTQLFDYNLDQYVWIAEMETRGNGHATINTLIESAVSETIKKLICDKLISAPYTPPR